MTFEDFSLDPKITAAIRSVGYTSPTPIQQKAIPVVMEERDVLGIAQTLIFAWCIQGRNPPCDRNPTVAGRSTAPPTRFRQPRHARDKDKPPSETSPFVFDRLDAGERPRRGLCARQWGIRQGNNMPESLVRRLNHTGVSCRRQKRPKG